MLIYTKLWKELKNRRMKKTDLLQVVSSPTLAKLGKNEIVTTEVIGKICDFLDCQPNDIMTNVKKEQLDKLENTLENALDKIISAINSKTGMDKDDLRNEFMKRGQDMLQDIINNQDDAEE